MTNELDLSHLPPKDNTLIVLIGPTGVGKTALSLRLSEVFNMAILSADSRQFYREMPIGTAAPTPDELRKSKHYFVGNLSVTEPYSAGQFELDALEVLRVLFQSQSMAMLTGGSMMYIDAVCKGMDQMPAVNPQIRAFWRSELQEKGLSFLQEALREVDPNYWEQVDRMNPQRMIHALEMYSATGIPFSQFRTGIVKVRPFRLLKIGLNRPRNELYERINLRVELMMQQGLLAEVESLIPYQQLNALNTVGYKELFAHMKGEYSVQKAVELIQRNTRHYAKRQLTWFKRDAEIHWFHPNDEENIVRFIEQQVMKQRI